MGQPRYQRDGDPRTSGPGFGVTLHEDKLAEPLRWRKERMVFVNSMSDLFHEEIPDEFITDVFAIMQSAPQHTFQVLTKRPERACELLADDPGYAMRKIIAGPWRSPEEVWPLPNVWLGVSIENARYTWRADVLREIPAAVRFISAEPLLGSLLPEAFECPRCEGQRYDRGSCGLCGNRGVLDDRGECNRLPLDLTGIDWLIVGGESGGKAARPMHPEWARELRDACLEHVEPGDLGDVRPAFFFKQWGSWAEAHIGNVDRAGEHRFLQPDGEDRTKRPLDEHDDETAHMVYVGTSPKSGGRLLDGREWNEMPQPTAGAGA
jgi:protein gp37